MPGYLAEKMNLQLGPTLGLNPRHFALLRLARLRGLRVSESLGGGLYSVPSYSRRDDNLHWIVTLDTCSCPALGYCTHRATAVDWHYTNEAEPREYLAYMNAQRDDFAALELRVLHGEQTTEDKAFTRPLIEKVRARQAPYATPEPVGCQF